MGIFSSIKEKIFGKKDDDAEKAEATPAVAPPTQGTAPAPMSEIDVEAQLSAMNGADRLNWRTSIVDLMKLLGIDSSYANRKALAQELGRTDYEGSAEDNIWLMKATMQELANNGGRVPADMLD